MTIFTINMRVLAALGLVSSMVQSQEGVFVDDDTTGSVVCTSDTNTYTVKLDLYASQLGYYTFEECGDMVNPTIGMEVGQTYTFIQTDRTNYFHPLGFSYFPDGAHDGVDELEPGIAQGSDASCTEDLSCPAPMYFLNDDYLGTYSNIAGVLDDGAVSSGEDNFGLDDYEPLFFHPLPDWLGYGNFSIQLNFDDESYDKDIFYFCHIHQFMTGRIKLMKDGEIIAPENDPPIDYDYDMPGEFDAQCGTYGLEAFQLPNLACPETFVCGATAENQPFATCIDAMNCHMFAGMSLKSSDSDIGLFIDNMIPHHENAINMAKTLLITGDTECADLTDDEDPLCAMQTILREIINGQNAQIQGMRAIKDALSLPDATNCVMEIVSRQAGDGDEDGDMVDPNAADDFFSEDQAAPPLDEEDGDGIRGRFRGRRNKRMRK